MKKTNENSKLAVQMLSAMVAGILVGILFMVLRENLGADSSVWTTLNRLPFQDITTEGGESSIGIFYIYGQLFIRALQLIIVPMVFSSVVMAINRPIEMLVTSLNCVGDSVACITVAKSENKFDQDVYNK